MADASHPVFLSCASQDAEAAQRIAEALRAAANLRSGSGTTASSVATTPSAGPHRLTNGAAHNLTTASLAVLLAFQPVLATPPTTPMESTHSTHRVYYTFTVDPDAIDRVQITLPTSFEYEEDVEVSQPTRSPAVFLLMDATFGPNWNNGWHYHPGVVLSTVVDGQIDWYDANCVRRVYRPGDQFEEGDRSIHFVRNSTSTPARMIQIFILTKGISFKIPAAVPPCAGPLGLK